MRPPSPRVLANTADVYRLDPSLSGAYDADGGVVPASAYPSTPDAAAVPCRYCPDYGDRVELAQGRVGQVNGGLVIFGQDMALKVNDRLVIAGQTYYVDGNTDMATAGAAWGVPVRALV